MAQYQHLPIYKVTHQLLELVTRKVRDFPRDYKFSLGDKIRNECIDLMVFMQQLPGDCQACRGPLQEIH